MAGGSRAGRQTFSARRRDRDHGRAGDGATGFVGSRLVPVLLERGHAVTVLVRDADRYAGSPAVGVVEGDLLEPGSVAAGLDVEAANYPVRSMRAGTDFEERDRRAVRFRFDARTAAGLRRTDATNVAFALVQLAPVPPLTDRPVFLVAVGGHGLAVTVVSTAAYALVREE